MSRMMLLLVGIGCSVSTLGCSGINPPSPLPVQRCHSGACDDCLPCNAPYFGKYSLYCDNVVARETALHCAKRAMKQYKCETGCVMSHDYAAGFESAFVDLAENRLPRPPSVPPSKYWSAYYRSCAGRPHVEDWYAGYNAGLEVGSQSGVSRFNRIDIWTCGTQEDSSATFAGQNNDGFSSTTAPATQGGLCNRR